MIDLWMLNVGHGDSIVIRCESGGKQHFGVIDSNCNKGQEPRALVKLRELGADRVSFVMLTHPHADHYRGLLKLMREYQGRVNTFYSFPIRTFLSAPRVRKFKEAVESIVANTEGELLDNSLELAELLIFADSESDKGVLHWEEVQGRWNQLHPQGCEVATWEALLPLPKSKGEFFQLLGLGDPSALTSTAPNNLSIALRITAGGTSILLGADSTEKSWRDHRHQMGLHPQRASATVLKVPHHGSHLDVPESLFPYWFADSAKNEQQLYGLISADGKGHPHPEVLARMSAAKIHPYCTNLARPCGGRRVDQLFTAADVPSEVVRIINSGEVEVLEGNRQPCQGEVHVSISEDGKVQVVPQFNHPCAYRGDFARLLG